MALMSSKGQAQRRNKQTHLAQSQTGTGKRRHWSVELPKIFGGKQFKIIYFGFLRRSKHICLNLLKVAIVS